MFCGIDRIYRLRVLAEFEDSKACSETSDKLIEILYDDGYQSVVVTQVLPGLRNQKNSVWRWLIKPSVQFVSVSDGVEELCEKCFSTVKLFHALRPSPSCKEPVPLLCLAWLVTVAPLPRRLW